MGGGCVQSGLNTLRRGDGEKGLGHAGAETGEHRPRARHLAVGVGEQFFVLVKGDEPCRFPLVLSLCVCMTAGITYECLPWPNCQ